MKKLFLIASLLFALEKVFALPIGNPSNASLFFYTTPCDNNSYSDPCDQVGLCSSFLDIVRFDVGFYGDYVFNRHLETVTNRKIDYSQISTNAGYIAINFWELVDVFTTLGASKFSFNTSLGPFNDTNKSPRFTFESATAFSWSVGANATLLECKCLAFGLMGQYFACCPIPRVLFVRANVNSYPDEDSRRRFSEWQIGGGLSYRYSSYFVPYVAVKYSRAFWHFNNQPFLVTDTLATIPNVRNARNWGYAIGVTLAPFLCRNLSITAEGRFADEAALYVNAQVLF